MRKIKLILQYDGGRYSGWQAQENAVTIQGLLEDALWRITGGAERVEAAGRTDAGVHALGQAAVFTTSSGLDAAVFKRALNAVLPPDIRVAEALEAAPDFHPRYDAKKKRYFYLIANHAVLSPFAARYSWHVRRPLDAAGMREAASHLTGRHDFKSFCAAGSSVKTTVREVSLLEVRRTDGVEFLGICLQGDFIRITVEADGFLRHMVRNIAGTLVEAGSGAISPDKMSEILSSRDRNAAGPTAPGRGLFLERVEY
jgi:tRNA pseudouridine38-40 synthase